MVGKGAGVLGDAGLHDDTAAQVQDGDICCVVGVEVYSFVKMSHQLGVEGDLDLG